MEATTRPRLTTTERSTIADRYLDGATIRSLAATYQVGTGAISTILRQHDIPAGTRRIRLPRGLTDADADQIATDYRNGASITALSAAYNKSTSTINFVLGIRGVQVRPSGSHPTRAQHAPA